MPSTIRVILSITCLAITTASCGGVKFSGESGQASGGSAEEPIDQPADVAGGLGLTCVPSANAVDASKTDFNCSFSDKSGKKFQERDDLKVDLQVKIGDQVISVTVSTANNVSSFSFTVEKTAVEKVQIATKFVNPKEGNKTLKDQTTELKNVIVSSEAKDQQSNSPSVQTIQACAGNCYQEGSAPNYTQDLPVGTERLGPDGMPLVLSYAIASSGFKIWKEKNGDRILNASGLVANGWQRKLTRAGTSYRNEFLVDSSKIEGRACPEKVFNGSSGPSTCLYYSSILDFSKTLQGTSTGVKGEDYLNEWTANKASAGEPCESSSNTTPAWYVGNIKTCADAGMRLPVLYEFKEWKSGCVEGRVDCSISHLPGIVSESDSNGLPASNVWTATASSRCNGDSLFGKYFWGVYQDQGQLRTASNPRSDSFAHIRCVLPGF